jgi:hypothetical protein
MPESPKPETATAEKPAAAEPDVVRAWLMGAAGWVVPGLGHWLLKKHDRALVFFFSIVTMAVLGIGMGAKLYGPPFSEGQGLFIATLHVLGFLGDLGAGGLFFAASFLGYGREYMSRALGDYGTVFFLSAGMMNLLTALDAYDLATGKKE